MSNILDHTGSTPALVTHSQYRDLALALTTNPSVRTPYLQLAQLVARGKHFDAPAEGIKIARKRLEDAAERGNATAVALLAEIRKAA